MEMWTKAKDDPSGFWGELAKENLDWFQDFDTVMEGDMPETKWFTGGKLNASYQCLDRHLVGPRKNKAAIIWEGEPGDQRILTYQQLHHEVCKFANVLKNLGCETGDRVTIYMPMVPELAVSMPGGHSMGNPTSFPSSYHLAELHFQSTALSTRPARTGFKWM
jgi:acetyl-CoA synthetase